MTRAKKSFLFFFAILASQKLVTKSVSSCGQSMELLRSYQESAGGADDAIISCCDRVHVRRHSTQMSVAETNTIFVHEKLCLCDLFFID